MEREDYVYVCMILLAIVRRAELWGVDWCGSGSGSGRV